jgi:nucleoside diphosphate kinase
LTNVATDFEVEDVGAIVKAADKVGLKIECRKEVNVTEEDLEDLRESGGKVANWKKEVRLSLSCRVLLPVW